MLVLREGLLRETLTLLRRCGASRDECVAYWTGPLDDQQLVDQTLHPQHTSGPDFYEVDQGWLTQTWIELARQRREIRVQIHTHGGRAGHSRTDDAFPIVQTCGFLSLVLPWHALRDDLSGAYLARLEFSGRWQQVAIDQALEVR